MRRVERSSVTLILGGAGTVTRYTPANRQVSKRKKPSSPYEAHDLHSNKPSSLSRETVGWVIGYTGPAYLDDKPTDRFIAEAVSQRELGGGRSVHFGDFHPGLQYMEVRRRIVDALTTAYSRLDQQVRDIPTTVLIAGSSWKPRLEHSRQVLGASWLVLTMPRQTQAAPPAQRLGTDARRYSRTGGVARASADGFTI